MKYLNMKTYKTPRFALAVLATLSLACSGGSQTTAASGGRESLSVGSASLGGIGSIAMPRAFAGGRVSAAMADAWAECPHSPEFSSWQSGAKELSVDAPLTAIRKDMRAAIAACQGTGGLTVTGDLFKDWVALRSNWACNVDTSGTNAAAVTV